MSEKEKTLQEQLSTQKTYTNNFESDNTKQKHIPIIRTFEDDAASIIKENKLDRIEISKAEADKNYHNNTYKNLDGVQIDSNKKKKIIIATIILLAIIFSSIFLYIYFFKKKVTSEPLIIKTYTAQDTWPEVAGEISTYTENSTSTKDYMIINIKDFNYIYAFMLRREDVIKDYANKYFNYENIGKFEDTIINNIDMRIADSPQGAVVYGFLTPNTNNGKNLPELIIANSINSFMRAYSM